MVSVRFRLFGRVFAVCAALLFANACDSVTTVTDVSPVVPTPGPPALIFRLAGDGQIGSAWTALPEPLRVRVADILNNPVAGVRVRFSVQTGDGEIADVRVFTDSNGVAESGLWILGALPGVQLAVAEAERLSAVFSARATAVPISGLRGKLAFVRMTDGNDEIYTINADGSTLARLTMNDGSDMAPAWSPDGSRIAFASDIHDSVPLHFSVYVMAGDGTGVTRTTNVPLLSASGPTWSPDGARLAFALYSPFAEKSSIATVGADDFSFDSLIERPERLYQPSWSSGGSMAYAAGWPYDSGLGIYLMLADGSGHTYMSSSLSRLWSPAWSPDGSMLAFIYDAHHSGRVHPHLGVMTSSGDFERDLGWTGDLGGGRVAWSPDGTGLAYTFWHCDAAAEVSCPEPLTSSVNYVSLDGAVRGTIVADAHSPSWTR